MRRRHLVTIFATLLLALLPTAVWASATGGETDEDTDLRIVDARVVEVTDERISVIARSGVEHVIAINRTDTKVLIDGEVVSCKDVRVGDVLTIELDAQNPLKFARNISMRSENTEIARNRR
jgi:archaellum component FlaG (FlaF/FlaG flagellin family)